MPTFEIYTRPALAAIDASESRRSLFPAIWTEASVYVLNAGAGGIKNGPRQQPEPLWITMGRAVSDRLPEAADDAPVRSQTSLRGQGAEAHSWRYIQQQLRASRL